MADKITKIKPLDPIYHGESNYEVGLEDLLAQTKEKLKKMQSDSTVTKEQLRLAEEDLQTLETLWENYHIGMNVFRNAKGGHDGLREVKAD